MRGKSSRFHLFSDLLLNIDLMNEFITNKVLKKCLKCSISVLKQEIFENFFKKKERCENVKHTFQIFLGGLYETIK